MEIKTVLDAALHAAGGNQAELARRLRRGDPTVSRWFNGSNKPDYESCLRLSLITNYPPDEVLRAAGLEPIISQSKTLTPIEEDVLRRVRRIQTAIDATEGIPDQFVEAVLMPMLKGTEENMLATIEAVKLMRRNEAAVSTPDTPPLSTQPAPDNVDSTRPGGNLATSYLGRTIPALVGVK